MASRIWKILMRRRIIENEEESELARVLNLVDLTALGVGATLGLGVYVLSASVAKDHAGPAVCISFLIAAIASAFAGLCYAEFASRVPKAGSAYVYSYVTVGEFIAFIIGWNMILEYVIGTASVARGLSNYLDALLGKVMRTTFHSFMPIDVPFLAEYPDFFAFTVVILLIVLLSCGVKESSIWNNIFTVVNLTTIVIIIIAGFIMADPGNWAITVDEINAKNITTAGTGGFMPFGISGIMVGAAKCFFGFVGFDTIATTGEEAKNPQRNIPLAIIFSLIISLTAYFCVSTVLTMMWPYYAQDPDAPFPYVFEQMGSHVIKWIVNVGAIFALCASLIGAMFPLPRIIYAMANDGVIFKFLSTIHPKTMTPVSSTLVSGLITGLMTLVFNLQQLIDMMSIGTLLAYTIVAISVLILRYDSDEISSETYYTDQMKTCQFNPVTVMKYIFNLQNQKQPNKMTSVVANFGVLIFSAVAFILGLVINSMGSELLNGNYAVYVIIFILVLILVLNVAAIGRQPVKNHEHLSFKVPLVPLIPCCSIFINLYLMLQLDLFTWMRFIVWLVIGFSIYFFYGINHSIQGEKDKIEANTLTRSYANEMKMMTKF